MEDKFEKYLKLSHRILLVLVVFIASLLLILFGLRLIVGMLDKLPWFTYLFTLFIIIVPSAIFITIFSVNIARTKYHPSASVKMVSYILLVAALLAWIYFLISDIVTFFKTAVQQINPYNSYSVLYLAGSVALIFAIAIIQALSTKKEKDWMEKRKERLGDSN
ncbi:MAG TPA: hypothetical protein PK504_04000 [Ferruginibacter sp.]|nr:hypothetical protein [Ferruginibacter sp.]HRE62935.1 hypothetical protein [Ferruginibacter sp.]